MKEKRGLLPATVGHSLVVRGDRERNASYKRAYRVGAAVRTRRVAWDYYWVTRIA